MFSYYANSQFDENYVRWFMSKHSRRRLGYYPNLSNPKSFNEKTQWYKLYYHDPLITRCTDKYLCKSYIADTVGEGYTPKTLGVWRNADDIDFDALPQSFVLKSTWGSGSRHVQIVRNKAKIGDLGELRFRANTWIQPWENVYYHTYDWGYKDIEPRLIAEELLRGITAEYKFYCFGGEPKFAIASSSKAGMRRYRDFYSLPSWERMHVKRNNPNFPEPIPKPDQLEEMMDLARKLAAPFPHVRVDFLLANNKVYIGELTFYSGSGVKPFYPRAGDFELGEFFTLPESML